MMNLKLRLKLRCPNHRSFKPEHGRGAVKAGCPACQDLCAIYTLTQQVVERVRYFERDYAPAVPAPASAIEVGA